MKLTGTKGNSGSPVLLTKPNGGGFVAIGTHIGWKLDKNVATPIGESFNNSYETAEQYLRQNFGTIQGHLITPQHPGGPSG